MMIVYDDCLYVLCFYMGLRCNVFLHLQRQNVRIGIGIQNGNELDAVHSSYVSVICINVHTTRDPLKSDFLSIKKKID